MLNAKPSVIPVDLSKHFTLCTRCTNQVTSTLSKKKKKKRLCWVPKSIQVRKINNQPKLYCWLLRQKIYSAFHHLTDGCELRMWKNRQHLSWCVTKSHCGDLVVMQDSGFPYLLQIRAVCLRGRSTGLFLASKGFIVNTRESFLDVSARLCSGHTCCQPLGGECFHILHVNACRAGDGSCIGWQAAQHAGWPRTDK